MAAAHLAFPGGYAPREGTALFEAGPMLVPVDDENWAVSGLCNQTDPDMWFLDIDPLITPRSEQAANAKKICRVCPVQPQCLIEGMHPLNEEWGIYGGLDPEERKALRKRSFRNRRLTTT